MKSRFSLPSFRSALAAGLLLIAPLLCLGAGDDHSQPSAQAPAGTLVPVSAQTDSAWLARARAAYALDHCPVCDDKLEAKSPDYIYRQAGQPDRLVRLCGDEECVPNFLKDPAKYLKMIDDAAAAKAGAH